MNDGMIGEEINDTEDNEEIAAEENDSERENENVSPDTEERRLEEILARTRFDRSATISSVTGTAIAFLVGAASSVLALFVRTDLAIGYTVLAVASYIAAFLMFNCMKVPEFVREKRKANMVFIAVLLSLCAVAAVLAVVMAYVSAEVYGYDSAIYFGTVDGLYYTDTVIYEAADIDIYRIVLWSLAIGSASMSLALAAFSVSGILLTRVPLDRTEENAADVPPDVNNDGQKSLDDVPSSRRNYDGKLEAVRERIAYAEKLYRSGMITEEEYHELKLGILFFRLFIRQNGRTVIKHKIKCREECPIMFCEYKDKLETVREKIASAERAYREGNITEEEYCALKRRLLSYVLPCDDYYSEPDFRYVIIKIRESTILEKGSLYEAVRRAWRINVDRISGYRYVFAVVDGVVRGIFIARQWKKVTSGPDAGRYEFFGDNAPYELEHKFIRKRIPPYYSKFGMASPVLYCPSRESRV